MDLAAGNETVSPRLMQTRAGRRRTRAGYYSTARHGAVSQPVLRILAGSIGPARFYAEQLLSRRSGRPRSGTHLVL